MLGAVRQYGLFRDIIYARADTRCNAKCAAGCSTSLWTEQSLVVRNSCFTVFVSAHVSAA